MGTWREWIVCDPNVMLGKPVIKGTRITVELILEKLAAGETIEDILAAHPHLSREAVQAAIVHIQMKVEKGEVMVVEKIQERVRALPPSLQEEVLDFIEYLLSKTEREAMERERREWSALSLELAMRDMKDEVTPEYTVEGL